MNSIMKICFRQTEDLLRHTKRMVSIVQLQLDFAHDGVDFSGLQEEHQCVFSYDLDNELRLLHERLHSTCFLLQRALYRVQALRQTRNDLSFQIHDDLIYSYKQDIVQRLNAIQQRMLLIIDQHNISDTPLNELLISFKHIQDNFNALFHHSNRMSDHRNTLYLGSLVSNTLEKFYFIFHSLTQLVEYIERFERNRDE